jgi:AraC-like DNA-binding protein
MDDMQENLHFMILGDQLKMPLISMTGYNSFIKAEYLGWHKHNGFELTFALKSSVIWEIEDDSKQHLSSGHISLVSPHVAHRGMDDVTHPCEMVFIVFEPLKNDALSNTPFSASDMENIYTIFSSAGNKMIKANDFIFNLLNEYRKALVLYEAKSSHYMIESQLRGLLSQIILQCALSFKDNEELQLSREIQIALEYMKEHFTEDIEIKHVADHIHKSTTFLYNTFKKEIGQAPNEYILRLRLEKACKELKSSDKSITEISFDAGYTSTQYFSKMFNRFTGRTPSSYRKNQNIDELISIKYYP